MSTILGPLVNGLRILFKIDFDVTNHPDLMYMEIFDKLPSGLAWYSEENNDSRNALIINNVPLNKTDYYINYGSDYDFFFVILDTRKISANDHVSAYIDTYVNDASLINQLTNVMNQAEVVIRQLDNLLHVQTSHYGSYNEAISFNGNDISYIGPHYISIDTTKPFTPTLAFTAGKSTDQALNYTIKADLGVNLDIDSSLPVKEQITAMYDDKKGHTGPIPELTFTNNGSIYTIAIPIDDFLAQKEITIAINTKLDYDTVIPSFINFKYKLTIGMADMEYKLEEIPIRNIITINKSVV